MLAFYERMARGGTGLIIVESPTIDYPAGAAGAMRYRIDDDRSSGGSRSGGRHPQARLPHLHADEPRRPLAGRPPPHRARPGLRRSAARRLAGGRCPTRPTSTTRCPRRSPSPRSRTWWTSSPQRAVRAKKAGFDGVDVNAASSHLLHNFLSPFWNRRTDIYGGNSENRCRFPSQVISGDQAACAARTSPAR